MALESSTNLPTMEDVARRAGVSTATVSRVLNQPAAVRAPLREQVERAVAAMGYVPHAGARNLKTRRSGTVGVVVPTIDNAIFAAGVQAFQRRMADAGVVVLLAVSNYNPQQEDEQVSSLLARGVDAVALTGASQLPTLLQRLAQRKVPWVHTGSFPGPVGATSVGFRNRDAMARAVRYMLDLGHERIALIAGITAHNDRAAERVAGVQAALEAAGSSLPSAWLLEAPYTPAAARQAMAQLLEQPNGPTAVLCGNDVLAFGALLECAARGVEVPRQMSVLGFADLEFARHWQPALTTVRIPTEPMWTLAAEELLAQLDGRHGAGRQHELAVELVVRASSGPVPRDNA